MQEYEIYSDPGHAWLKVSIAELKRLKIYNKISMFSYRNGNNAYLEEDCDMNLFLKRKEEVGERVEKLWETTTNGNCFVRSYRRFKRW